MDRFVRMFGFGIGCLLAASAALAQEAPAQATPETDTTSEAALGGLSLNGEFVYLMPSFDDTFFVLKASAPSVTPVGEREDNEPGFNPGFRLGLAYEFPESKRRISLDYLFLDVEQKTSVSGGSLFATRGTPDFTSAFESYSGTAKSDLDLSYQRVNAAFTQPWSVSDLDIALRAGLEYAYFQTGQEIFYDAGTLGALDERSRTWGIGPELGVGLDYHVLPDSIPGDLSLNLLTSLAALVAQSDSHARAVVSGSATPLLNVDDEDQMRLVPGLHARVGFTYGLDLSGLGAAVSLGYQLDNYFDALKTASYPDDVGDSLATTQESDFSAQGLYLTATLTF
jgi:hypothetical protein